MIYQKCITQKSDDGMKYFVLLFTLFLSVSVSAQTDTLTRYFNGSLQSVGRTSGIYNGKAYLTADGWQAIIYNNAGVLIARGGYKDKSLQTKNGLFTYYYPSGKIQVEGWMQNNVQEGCWKGWYDGGELKDSVFFSRGYKTGPSYSWFENGTPKHVGTFANNQPTGDWTWYHENGNPSTKEKYQGGKIISLECFDSTGKASGIQCALETEPSIKGRYGGIHKYIVDSLLYPADALKKNIEGVVQVEFTVTKGGEVKDFHILSSPDKLLSDEVLRVILSVPGWYPAIEHNRPIDYIVKMNVPFYKNMQGDD